jgi:hypothetical protein
MMLTEFVWPQLDPSDWLGIGGLLGFAALTSWFGLRRSGVYRMFLLGLAAVAALRLVLLANPFAWQVYAESLDAGDVGWRQYDLITIQRDRYFSGQPGPRYLAVGSSQTEAIYGRSAAADPDLDMFIVAAMMPMDFVLYAEEIVRRRPQTVLLYLSEFDIAKRPSPEATVLAPAQGVGLLRVGHRLQGLPHEEALGDAIVELAFGEFFPEFRYRFIYRAALDNLFERVARRLGDSRKAPRSPSTEAERIRWLRESLSAEHIDFNLAWLADFLHLMESHGIEVLMIEGHYHPAVMNEDLAAMNARTRAALEMLDARFEAVRFVPGADLPPLGAVDYSDLTHVTPEAAEQFVRELFERHLLAWAESSPGAT